MAAVGDARPAVVLGVQGIDSRRARAELRIGLIGFTLETVQFESTLNESLNRVCADNSIPA